MLRSDLLALTTLLAAAPVAGQDAPLRPVVSNEVAVSGDDATLRLEFESGELSVSFREGTVLLDGRSVGTFARGDALETSWRALLGQAVALDDGPLARALVDWEPPASLSGEAVEVAARVDRALEGALRAPPPAPRAPAAPEAPTVPRLDERSVLRSLLRRTELLQELGVALEDVRIEDDAVVYVGEDVELDADTRVDGPVLVIDGDLELAGEIRGDVAVIDGSIRLLEGSRVTGDIRLVEARIYRDGGVVEGDVTDVEAEVEAADHQSLDEIREEIRREIRNEIRSSTRGKEGFLSELSGSVGRGIAGILQNLVTFALLAALGVGLMHYAPGRVEVVDEAVRRAPGRAGIVGLAGIFLLLPVWILGTVALAISLIGIPALIAWVPLFPVAAGLAALAGYLVVAGVVGQWLARRRIEGLDWLRVSNPHTTVVGGIAALMLFFVAANLFEMAGWVLGFLAGLLALLGFLATAAATVVGFGAVILTRGGRRREYPIDDGYDAGPSTWPPDPGARPSGPRAEHPFPGEASSTGATDASGASGIRETARTEGEGTASPPEDADPFPSEPPADPRHRTSGEENDV